MINPLYYYTNIVTIIIQLQIVIQIKYCKNNLKNNNKAGKEMYVH
jgi:hypothetical protein